MRVRNRGIPSLAGGLMALAGVLTGCTDRPDRALVGPRGAPNEVPQFFHEGLPPAGQAELCKVGAPATFVLTTSDASRGTFPRGDTVQLVAGECAIVWQSTSSATPDTPAVIVNVTELTPPNGIVFDSVVGYQTIESSVRTWRTAPDFRFRVNAYHSAIAEFYNSYTAPPPPPDSVVICKEGPPGTYNFSVSQSGGRGGTLLEGSAFTLQAGECKTVWQALPNPPIPDTPAVQVVVDEVGIPSDIVLDSVVGSSDSLGPFTQTSGEVRFPVNFFHGGIATYYNRQLPPPRTSTIRVCKVGPTGTYNFTITAATGSFLQGNPFTLAAGECQDVWESDPSRDPNDPLQTVTVSEIDLPAGVQFDSIVGSTTDTLPPQTFTGRAIEFDVNAFHGGSATYYNSDIPQPPPPPPVCSGLTPGYWKNWRNHYTEAQFTQLLQGTIAGSIAEADLIFGKLDQKKGVEPIDKLKWFVLANQLTLNLTLLNDGGAGLPNPSNGNLIGSCAPAGGGSQLGDAMTTALAIIANPRGYSRSQILGIKDILDAIANLGGG